MSAVAIGPEKPSDKIGEALKRAYPPITDGVFDEGEFQILEGRAVKGFGIASGRTESRYKGSTIKRQILALDAMARGRIPFISTERRQHAARLRDFLLSYLPNRDVPGTINMDTDLFIVPIDSKATDKIDGFVWSIKLPGGEDFKYYKVFLLHVNPRTGEERTYRACVYYPEPHTKGNAGGESHNFARLEILTTEWVGDLQYGDPLAICARQGTFITFPQEQGVNKRLLSQARKQGVVVDRKTPRFNELSKKEKIVAKAIANNLDPSRWPEFKLAT